MNIWSVCVRRGNVRSQNLGNFGHQSWGSGQLGLKMEVVARPALLVLLGL
jgi:hypothetical protein